MVITWFILFLITVLPIRIYYALGNEDFISRNGQVTVTEAFTTCSKGWFTFGDMCYKLGGKKKIGRLTWEAARQACKEDYNGDLATVYSKEIQNFLKTLLLLNAQSNVWIGLHDKGNETDFHWADGTPYNYSNFEPLEPSAFAREEEDCIEMVFKSLRTFGEPGQWNDISCSGEIQFICQKTKGKQSSKNVLDSRYCTTQQGIGWRFEKSCFYVVTENKTWSEAEDFCVDQYNGHLATIDYRVNEYLKYILQKVTEQLWIGVKIKEKPQQEWSSGWLVSFENWPQQEEYEDGTCVLRDGDGSWQIHSCKKKLWFLCEYSTATPVVLKPSVENAHCPEQPTVWRDLGGDFCYFFDIQARINWYEANFNCMRRGGSLVSIHSQEEVDILFQFVRYNPGYRIFIGLYRPMKYEDEEFVWADGSRLDFTYWDSGEPNREKEECTELWTENMRWNDRVCTERRGYICSVPKVTPNITTTEIPFQTQCKNTITISSMMGVIACVLVFSLLIGLVLYHFKLCDRGYERVKKLSGTKLQTPLELDKKSRYRSEIIVTDDPDYDNVA